MGAGPGSILPDGGGAGCAPWLIAAVLLMLVILAMLLL